MSRRLPVGPEITRAVSWGEFKRKVRAYPPSQLLRAIAAVGAQQWDGGPARVTGNQMQPWALAAIARESLADGTEHRDALVTEKAFRRLYDLFMNLEDPFLRRDGDGPWDLMVRLAHAQMDWQSGVYSSMARFKAIFNRDFNQKYKVLSRRSLIDLLGADPGAYAKASMIFTASAVRNDGWFDLAWLNQPCFANVVERIPALVLGQVFTSSFGTSYAFIAERAGSARHSDPALRRYDFNPLAATPFVQMGATKYLAPVPQMIDNRVSLNAVYYLGQQRWGGKFTEDLGELVDVYTGEQLAQAPRVMLSKTRAYQNGGRAETVDWLLVLRGVVLLVEVKSARVAYPGRRDRAGWAEDVCRDVGKAMTQITTTANLLRQGHPVLTDVPTDRPLRAIVVTAEPHHLVNSPIYRSDLPDPSVPTTVMSLQRLEEAVAWALVRDPSEVFLALTDYRDLPGYDSEQPEDLMNRWRREQELTRNPTNPILDAAWDRDGWHQENQAESQ